MGGRWFAVRLLVDFLVGGFAVGWFFLVCCDCGGFKFDGIVGVD